MLNEVLIKTPAVEDFEVEHEFPTIGQRNMLLNARRFPPESDDPQLVLLAIEDNTDYRRAEEKLRKTERRQRFVLDLMPQKIFTAKPNGERDYFNPQWTEFTGLSFEEIKGGGWKQIIHPDDLAETVRLWKHSVATGESYLAEHRVRRADGEYRWQVSRALPMRDETGTVLMWVGSNTDIHDIKLVDLALIDSEIRYRRLFETAKDGILILDTESGRITDANPFMGELLGYHTSISWARNSGKSDCSATKRPTKLLCERYKKVDTFVMNICRWKPAKECRSRLKLSPTLTGKTITKSFSEVKEILASVSKTV